MTKIKTYIIRILFVMTMITIGISNTVIRAEDLPWPYTNMSDIELDQVIQNNYNSEDGIFDQALMGQILSKRMEQLLQDNAKLENNDPIRGQEIAMLSNALGITIEEARQQVIDANNEKLRQYRNMYNDLTLIPDQTEGASGIVQGVTGGTTGGGLLNTGNGSALHTPDEIIGEGDDFISSAGNATINGDNLKLASSTLYNILLSLGIFIAVAVGVYLGVKFMMSSIEDKAKVKEALIPYICGCIVIFSAFIIWKLALTILGGI